MDVRVARPCNASRRRGVVSHGARRLLTRSIVSATIAQLLALTFLASVLTLAILVHAVHRNHMRFDASAARVISVVALDKTGTLTEGRFEVSREICSPEVDSSELLEALAAAEEGSTHPVGVAAREYAERVLCARGREVPRPTAQRTVPGLGVVALLEGAEVRAGRPELVRVGERAEDDVPAGSAEVESGDVGRRATTRIEVARAERWLGAIELSDRLRPSTLAAIAQLRALGLGLTMLTGDRAGVARDIGARLGLEPRAGLLPEDKVREVVRLRERGKVAFVGDGLNDAPALAAADLAVAATGATDLAQSVAHVALREGGIARLPEAFVLARRTVQVMRQNVGWAIAYNAVALPLAATGLVRPEMAAIAMAASSISVIASSLRLRSLPSESP